MQEINFLEALHTSTKRDYLERACLPDRAECMRVASQYGKDYWDGDRKYGYGGYKYDGRWKSVAEKIIEYYDLKKQTLSNPPSSIFDIGCGKGYLIFEFLKLGFEAIGTDVSQYAKEQLEHNFIFNMPAQSLSVLANKSMDFVYSINVLHNLGYANLKLAIREIVRVMKDKAWICVESFRNEEEKCNLLNWALTCQSYYSPDDWKNIFSDNGYKGDVGFVYFT